MSTEPVIGTPLGSTRPAPRFARTEALWHGGGAVGPTSRSRRARHRLRTLVSEHPALYLPFARHKYPGPSPQVIGPGTDLVIDGYTRSASTYAVYAFQVAQRQPVAVAHHLHAVAQLKEAARRCLPTIMVVREPRGAVLSQLVREPGVDLVDALAAYDRFHRALMPFRHSFVVADFEEVTHDFGAVVRRVNARFGTEYGVFGGTAAEEDLVTQLIAQRPTHSPVLLGFESGQVTLAEALAHLDTLAESEGEATWIPSPERDRAKGRLAGLWTSPAVARSVARAEASYQDFMRTA